MVLNSSNKTSPSHKDLILNWTPATNATITMKTPYDHNIYYVTNAEFLGFGAPDEKLNDIVTDNIIFLEGMDPKHYSRNGATFSLTNKGIEQALICHYKSIISNKITTYNCYSNFDASDYKSLVLDTSKDYKVYRLNLTTGGGGGLVVNTSIKLYELKYINSDWKAIPQ